MHAREAMLDEMRTFVLLAEEGSIQKVAQRLPLTQPAVTRQIQRLEQALGAELLDRRQKPPGLTPAGAEALRRCRDILAAYADMRQVTARGEPEGVLRLGLTHGLADRDFAAIAAEAARRFPRVTLRLTTGWSEPLRERLHRGQLDAVLVLSDPQAAGQAGLLCDEELRVVAAPERAETDLANAAWILSPEPCDARRALAAALSRRGWQLRIVAEVQDATLQLALVREGLGFGLMPQRRLGEKPPAGIVVVGGAELTIKLSLEVLCSPHLRGLTDVVDLIVGQLKAAVNGRSI
ncbi:DNA-binding transcriptional LysR family regulator [Bosea psychrotolerans]|uniref:DNA-binding transcriptional LysR family regulator n=2 Tax=Bosea psychrotolerans TaxID=1871628 RepID=A0A2S4M5H5_9HYPH|nr:DNA-binding transcriptional LysR family regulator [Bosea psychrotolerans]